MSKIRLNVEDLGVESFETSEDTGLNGTVFAHVTYGYQTECCSPNQIASSCCAGTEQTQCDGLCGGGNSAGLSTCCVSNACTQDPLQVPCQPSRVMECQDSIQYCELTIPFTRCGDGC